MNIHTKHAKLIIHDTESLTFAKITIVKMDKKNAEYPILNITWICLVC